MEQFVLLKNIRSDGLELRLFRCSHYYSSSFSLGPGLRTHRLSSSALVTVVSLWRALVICTNKCVCLSNKSHDYPAEEQDHKPDSINLQMGEDGKNNHPVGTVKVGSDMIYTIEDVPPWYLCILLGLQVPTCTLSQILMEPTEIDCWFKHLYVSTKFRANIKMYCGLYIASLPVVITVSVQPLFQFPAS